MTTFRYLLVPFSLYGRLFPSPLESWLLAVWASGLEGPQLKKAPAVALSENSLVVFLMLPTS